MRFARAALVTVALAGPCVGAAWSEGTEVAGLGLWMRAPGAFRAGASQEQDKDWRLELRPDRPGAAEVLLTLASHLHKDAEEAQSELDIARDLDAHQARTQTNGEEPRVASVEVPGAEEAYEVAALGRESSWCVLSARAGRLRVRVTITATGAAGAEAQEAWNLAHASLRVEEPQNHVRTALFWALGVLGSLALIVGLAGWGRSLPREATATPGPEADPTLELQLRAATPLRARTPLSRASDGLTLSQLQARSAEADASPPGPAAAAGPPAEAPLLRADEPWEPLPRHR